MKTEYEYLQFDQQVKGGKTSVWACRNKRQGEVLGHVQWYGAWRQYCYFPSVQAVYSEGCLNDIADFIKQLMDARTA